MIRERPARAELPNDGWTVQLLSNRKEHIRLIPCIFLEKWDKEHVDVVTTEELREAIKVRTGKEFKAQGAGNLVGAFNQKADRRGLPHLFAQVDDGRWRFYQRYLGLFREHCKAIHPAKCLSAKLDAITHTVAAALAQTNSAPVVPACGSKEGGLTW